MNPAASHKADAGLRPPAQVRRADGSQPNGAADFASAAGFESCERERQVLQLLSGQGLLPLSEMRILEVGCGTGRWLRDLISWGADPANLHGVELLEASAARGRRLCPPQVTIECGNAAELRVAPQSFDIVLQAGLFSSVFDQAMKATIAAEILRVLRPGGVVLWYDFCVGNDQNPYVQPISEDEIRGLFPECSGVLYRVSLATTLVRLLASRSPRMCAMLSRVPALCTHHLGALRKPAALQ